MKLTKEMIDNCASWVRVNGLYPQAGGAPVKQFCEAMDIDWKTYTRWMKIAHFADVIKKAQQDFRSDSVDELVNALKKKALGYTVTLSDSDYKAQVIKEFDPVTGKKIKEYATDQGIKVKESRKDVHMAPDTGAAIFLLTNLDPENWKNRRDNKTDVDLTLDAEEPPVIVFGTPGQEPAETKEEQQ